MCVREREILVVCTITQVVNDGTTEDGLMDVDSEPSKSGSPAIHSEIDPKFHSEFWSLQSYFSNPTVFFSSVEGTKNSLYTGAKDGQVRAIWSSLVCCCCFFKKIIPSDLNACVQAPLTLGPENSKWAEFHRILNHTLTIFESHPTITASTEMTTLEEKRQDYDTKYLTSYRLFQQELRDPLFRWQILTQCLIVFQYLKTALVEAQRSKKHPDKVSEFVSF